MQAVTRFLVALMMMTLPAVGQNTGTGGTSVGIAMSDHDSTQPIEITSDDLKLNQTDNNALFTGNVVVVQGNMTMTSEWMLVEYRSNADTGANEIWRITSKIDVVMVQEHPSDACKKPDVAESQQAVYTVDDETIVLTEDVLVVQDGTVLTSDRLDYFLPTGEGTMRGNVTTLIIPEGDSAGADPACP